MDQIVYIYDDKKLCIFYKLHGICSGMDLYVRSYMIHTYTTYVSV